MLNEHRKLDTEYVTNKYNWDKCRKLIRIEIVDRGKSEKIEDGVINDTHYNENRSSRREDYDR